MYISLSFKTFDKANSKFNLKIKEVLHINWGKSNLNVQQNHLVPTFSHVLKTLALVIGLVKGELWSIMALGDVWFNFFSETINL